GLLQQPLLRNRERRGDPSRSSVSSIGGWDPRALPMQTSTRLHAQVPGAVLTHPPAGQASQSVRKPPAPLKKTREMEVASVFEEIAAHDAAMPEIAIAFEMAVTIAPVEIVVPIGPVEQTPVAVTIAEAVTITIAKAVTILVEVLTVHVRRCAVIESAGPAIRSHAGRGTARSARRAVKAGTGSAATSWASSLGRKARARSATATAHAAPMVCGVSRGRKRKRNCSCQG